MKISMVRNEQHIRMQKFN